MLKSPLAMDAVLFVVIFALTYYLMEAWDAMSRPPRNWLPRSIFLIVAVLGVLVSPLLYIRDLYRYSYEGRFSFIPNFCNFFGCLFLARCYDYWTTRAMLRARRRF